MNFEEKEKLARSRDTSLEASGLRLKAARDLAGMSQVELGKASGVTKAAISNIEKARSYPSRKLMLYLRQEHRVDFNFLIYGDFSQLPGDVQETLFAILSDEQKKLDQKQD